jgi:hypothetical protein
MRYYIDLFILIMYNIYYSFSNLTERVAMRLTTFRIITAIAAAAFFWAPLMYTVSWLSDVYVLALLTDQFSVSYGDIAGNVARFIDNAAHDAALLGADVVDMLGLSCSKLAYDSAQELARRWREQRRLKAIGKAAI